MHYVDLEGTTSKKFSIKSVYDHLTREDNGHAYTSIWKAKIPEKLKIFMWLRAQKSILTKDNMIKTIWGGGGPGCSFCNVAETVDVVFLGN
jgi:hypothetical protein